MYVEQKTLGNLGRFHFHNPFRGNPLKRVVRNVIQRPVKQFARNPLAIVNPTTWFGTFAASGGNAGIANKFVAAQTAGAAALVGPAIGMSSGPVTVPMDTPSGNIGVSADPYVNQMGPTYQTYPVPQSADYYPPEQLPPSAGAYLNPDMTQVGSDMNIPPDPNAPPRAPKDSAGGMGKGVLILGAIGFAALVLKRRKSR